MKTTKQILQSTWTTSNVNRGNMTAVLANPEQFFSFLDASQNRIGKKMSHHTSLATALILRSVCNRAPIAMSVVRIEDGKVLLSNPAMQRLLGYTRQELAGMPFTQFTHPEDVEKQKEAYLKIKSRQNVSFDMKKRYVRKDGTSFAAHLASTVVPRSSIKAVVMIGMIMETK